MRPTSHFFNPTAFRALFKIKLNLGLNRSVEVGFLLLNHHPPFERIGDSNQRTEKPPSSRVKLAIVAEATAPFLIPRLRLVTSNYSIKRPKTEKNSVGSSIIALSCRFGIIERQ